MAISNKQIFVMHFPHPRSCLPSKTNKNKIENKKTLKGPVIKTNKSSNIQFDHSYTDQ